MKQLQPIVVAEENPDDLYLLTRRIKASGFKNPIVNFFDPADTVAYMERALTSQDEFAIPCVLFTDLHLLGGDGFEIITWVRQQPRLGKMKVFIISNSDNPTHRKRAEELRVSGFLAKFPSNEVVAELLSDVCGEV